MPQPLRTKDNKVAGFIVGKVFVKKVKQSIHQLRTPCGYAVDADIFDSLYKLGVTDIILFDTENNVTYRSTWENFHRQRTLIDRLGYDRQWLLAMRFWIREDTNPKELNELFRKTPKIKSYPNR